MNVMKKKNIIKVDTDIYPLDAVKAAAYIFLQDNFVRIEKTETPNIVAVMIKSAVENIKDSFFNELLHETLRFKISENSKSLRERIVIRALASANNQPKKIQKNESETTDNVPSSDVVLEQEIEKLLKEANEGSYTTDPLKISVPWEETDNSLSKKETDK